MPKRLTSILPIIAMLVALIPASALAARSSKFYREGGEIFDDWDICRTNSVGEDGFFQISVAGFCPLSPTRVWGTTQTALIVLASNSP